MNQTMTDWHLVIVDDGSTDESVRVASETVGTDPRFRIVTQPNGGVASARMAGLASLDNGSPFVVFLDADDLWIPETLSILVAALTSEPEGVVAVFGAEGIVDDTGSAVTPHTPYGDDGLHRFIDGRVRIDRGSNELTRLDIAAVSPITTPGQCLIRRSSIEAVAATFDRDLSPCEDWDFWFQLSDVGNVKYLPTKVLEYRQHEGNASAHLDLMRRQRSRFYLKNREQLSQNGSATFRRLYAFGMYGYDARLCTRWFRESVRRRELAHAIRYLRRAAVFRGRYIAALLR